VTHQFLASANWLELQSLRKIKFPFSKLELHRKHTQHLCTQLFLRQTQRWHTFLEEEHAAAVTVVGEADLAEEEVAIEEVGEVSQEVVEVDEVSFTSPRSDSQSRFSNRWATPLQLRKDYETKSS
jgi:hypothetical protein